MSCPRLLFQPAWHFNTQSVFFLKRSPEFVALLQPGGSLIFSAPYTRSAQTVEHYPGLREYAILDFRGGKILVNRDQAGVLQVYDNLVFHGGEGATLEMRLFCEADVQGEN